MAGVWLRAETAPAAGSDPSKRLEWLNSRMPTPVPAPPAPKAIGPTKVRFRANPIAPRTVEPPLVEVKPAETPPAEPHPAKPNPADAPSTKSSSGETRIAKATPPAPSKTLAAVPTPAKTRSPEAVSTPAAKSKATPALATNPASATTAAKATPVAAVKPTPPTVAAAPASTKTRSTEVAATPAAKPKPTPAVASNPAPESRSAKSATPAPAKTTPVAVVAAASTAKSRATAATSTPAPKATPAPVVAAPPAEARSAKTAPAPAAKPTPTPAPVVAAPTPGRNRLAELRAGTSVPPTEVASVRSASTRPIFGQSRGGVDNRYPWKTDIVTTVFWIGEPVGGRNFTPNFASSWDPHWTQAYGGFDTPDPAGRRNYIPVKFTPKQNPFYVALPYNDVTRGTTKPESRLVIPWFKEAFEKEGQSVCRDRWVAVRNRAGKVGYAQWSDCGPFRTDHWQYVFGNEKPKPNLNKGAGLDVSPALRDFLELGSTDVTDWKFVDAKEVPGGPWALYGDNNILARRGSNPAKRTVKETSKPAGAPGVRVGAL